jgi:hypothetical protein
VVKVTARTAEKTVTKSGFAGTDTIAAPHAFQHASRPKWIEITRQLNSSSNADLLCRAGWNPAAAVEIKKMMVAGQAKVDWRQRSGPVFGRYS